MIVVVVVAVVVVAVGTVLVVVCRLVGWGARDRLRGTGAGGRGRIAPTTSQHGLEDTDREAGKATDHAQTLWASTGARPPS